jgi:hypothetical protein
MTINRGESSFTNSRIEWRKEKREWVKVQACGSRTKMKKEARGRIYDFRFC